MHYVIPPVTAATFATPQMAIDLSDRTINELFLGPGTFTYFSADEAAHMRDVRVLLYGFLMIALVGALFVAASMIRAPRDAGRWLAIGRGGAGLAVGVVVVGLVGLLAFNLAFELFHQDPVSGRELVVRSVELADSPVPGHVLAAEQRCPGRPGTDRRRGDVVVRATARGAVGGRMTATAELAARPLLSLEEARAQMLNGLEPLAAEEVAVADALGRVLASDLVSGTTLPPWDNSAMDGFAVRAADVAGAREGTPVRLRVIGESAAGALPVLRVEPGTALRILTGAPVPDGADAVVPVEQTDAPMGMAELPSEVVVHASVPAGAHIRRAGSDLRAGQPLLARGTALASSTLAAAAAGGHGTLSVHRRPRVAILATGDELATAGAPLGPAQIPDSNSVGLAAAAREAGAEVMPLGIARDNVASVLEALERGRAWADVIVASGGVSVGAHDVVKDAFASIGRLELWRIAVQPGKPLAFGRTPAQGRAGDVLFFGLPGNPVSSLVTFELFVRPVLRLMSGQRDLVGREIVNARLADPVRKAPKRRAFLRVRLERDNAGWLASLAGGQDSHILSALAAADGLAIVPEDVDELPAGAEVEVIRLR